MNNIDSIYSEHILLLAKGLKNEDVVDEDYVKIKYHNPSCGDVLDLYFKSTDGIIQDTKVSMDGCVISKASTNLLMGKIKGKSLEEVKSIMPYDMHNMLGVNVGEMRAPCVLTPYFALRKYLENIC